AGDPSPPPHAGARPPAGTAPVESALGCRHRFQPQPRRHAQARRAVGIAEQARAVAAPAAEAPEGVNGWVRSYCPADGAVHETCVKTLHALAPPGTASQAKAAGDAPGEQVTG